jgi:asparagine synthase (glutamine-hydrolysing)
MCRIIGYFPFRKTNRLHLDDLNKMRDVLAYGGPDDAGEFLDQETGLYLGHRRLSILDTSSAGHQPMKWGNWVICYNGEVYNFKEVGCELRDAGYNLNTASDTEVIIKAFDCWGYEAVQKFRGMFVFALWNTETKKLLLCRDRVGVKPLYYYHKNGVFIFGSELKAFRQYKNFDASISQDAVSLFLQTGYIRTPYSIYAHAFKLAPGHFLEISVDAQVKIWSYWDVNTMEVNDAIRRSNQEDIIGKAESLIQEASNLRMVSDVPVGVFLSGGIDSSLITAILQKRSTEQIKTFTIGFESAGFDESVYAREIAAYLGTEHREYICKEEDFLKVIPKLQDMYDEPFGDSSAIPTHLVASLAKQHVTVALSADGGDEVFGGYIRYKIISKYYPYLSILPFLVRKKLANIISRIPFSFWKTLLSILGQDKKIHSLEWRLPKLLNIFSANGKLDMYERGFVNIPEQLLLELHKSRKIPIFDSNSNQENKDLLNLLGKVDIQSYLEGDILTKVDRATMQVALEGREPLLDHRVIEFGLSLPSSFKIRKGEKKWILKKILEKHLPKNLWDRPKWGFSVPVKYWLTNLLANELIEMSNDADFHKRFSLNGDVLKKIVTQFLDKNSLAINPHFMWSIFMLYKWHSKW